MENENGKLFYGTGLDNSQLRVGAAEAKRLLHGIGSTASSEGDKIDDSMKKIGKAVAGVFAVSQIKEDMLRTIEASSLQTEEDARKNVVWRWVCQLAGLFAPLF